MSRVLILGMPRKASTKLTKIFKTVEVPCEILDSFEAGFERVQGDPPALIIAEKPDSVESLYHLQALLQAKAPLTPLIVSLPKPKADQALECMRVGAYDCVARPFEKLDVLATAKRACGKNRHTLFVQKVVPQKRGYAWPILMGLFISLGWYGHRKLLQGPPPSTISLGSAHLSGLQWDGRTLWVGDWFDSTITEYRARTGWSRGKRTLKAETIFRMREGQPILTCSIPDAFFTIAADLKMRSHYRSTDLNTLHTMDIPGTHPTGLAWDGLNVWSSDSQTQSLYRHGPDLKVLETVKSLVPNPVALAGENGALWVIGGSPLRVAQLIRHEDGAIWKGPYYLNSVMGEGVVPTGAAVGFNRLWFISGGDPEMVSFPIDQLVSVWQETFKSRKEI